MFKRENRLAPSVRFGKQHLFSISEFVLKEKKNGLLLNRFGIVVSKKVDKRATVRNKIKRIFRQALINLDKNMEAGHDILIIVRSAVLSKTKDEISLLVKKAFEKTGLAKAKNEN